MNGYATLAVGPRDVACWPPVGWEVREEANVVQTQVNRHAGATYVGERVA